MNHHRIQSASGTWLNLWDDGRVTNDYHQDMLDGPRLLTKDHRDHFARVVPNKPGVWSGYEDRYLSSLAHAITHPRKYF